MSKAISEFLTITLLVSFVMIVAVLVIFFGKDFVSKIMSSTGTQTTTLAECSTGRMTIMTDSPKCSGSYVNEWNSSWLYKRQITITSSNLPIHSIVNITLNHASLVSAGKSLSNGYDIRIIYWNGTGNQEVYRSNLTPFNTVNTVLVFRTQSAIAGTDNNYYMYYGNPSAENPE